MDQAGRLVIPSEIRREAALEPGTPLEVRWHDGMIEIDTMYSGDFGFRKILKRSFGHRKCNGKPLDRFTYDSEIGIAGLNLQRNFPDNFF